MKELSFTLLEINLGSETRKIFTPNLPAKFIKKGWKAPAKNIQEIRLEESKAQGGKIISDNIMDMCVRWLWIPINTKAFVTIHYGA